MTDWSRVSNLLGDEGMAHLARRRVAIVGLGSGGGAVALFLAMSGVQRFVLVDDDRLEEGNLLRHVADRRYLGQAKVTAVADLLRQRNPQVQVVTLKGRFEQHPEALDDVDLLVVAVDNEPARHALNEAALARRLTAVYAGVYERAVGGDVALLRAGVDACYACWAAELRDEEAPQDQPDYGMLGPEGTLAAEPGLWLHVTRVAAAQAQLALNELLRGSPAHEQLPGNTVLLANRGLEIIEGQLTLPQGAIWATIERKPDCLVCGPAFRDQTPAQSEDGAQDPSLAELLNDRPARMQVEEHEE
ncbi:MAG: ThiF family adenylyltransferase [Anaerolineaceae bacterium]|nr:ThiF family adenylyltransferase [Anaerolineaceae bacterium]